jgi:serine protease
VVYAADAGANVINMSWGGTGGGQTGQNIMNYANNKGCILVAASGNSNNTTTFYPAGFNHVISVSATQPNDTKASFSNYGSYVKISAPGTSILSTYIGGSGSTVTNTYGRIQGTSMASPIVAGLVGLMFSVNPNLTKQQVENCLYTTADPVAPGTGYNVNQMGAGRINAFQCLQCVAQTVNNPPISAISAQSGQNICPGGTITFLGGSTGGQPTSYQWTFPGGTPSTSSLQNPTVTYAALGTYDVTLTTTNSFGQSTVTSQNFVNVAPGAPTLIFREDFEDGSMQPGWTVNNPDNSNTWVLATTAGNITGTRSARMSFHNYSAVGQRDGLRTPPLDLTNYSNISMNFTHAYRRRQGGSTAPSDSLIVKISTDGGQSFTRVFTAAENGSGTFATGVTTTNAFTPQSAADWCFGGDVGASCFTIQFPMAGGNNNVIIEFEGYNNNQNHLYVDDVEIRGLCQSPPPGPVADFFVSKSSICAGETVQFTDNSPNANSWNWTFQGGAPAISTAQNPLVAYASPGTYDVTLTVSGTSGTDQSVNPGLIVVNAAPLAAVTINNGVLTALPSGQQSYQWMLNGMPIPGENGETYTPTGDGNYSVIVISNEGCTATSPAFSFTLGIDGQLESFGLSIYPNPGSEFVNISLGKEVTGVFQISLHDQAGRQLWGRAMELGLGTPIYVGNLPNGVYHLRLVSPQGQLINGKVQVLR